MTFAFRAGPCAEAPPEPAPAARRAGARLLVIDPAAGEDGALEALAAHGFTMLRRASLAEARPLIAMGEADLVILETALTGEDWLAACREIASGGGPAVMVYAARCEILDRVAALEFGAEDCLAKPAHPLELLARVRAALRRGAREAPATAPAAEGWRFDSACDLILAADGRSVALTPSEAAVLRVLMEAAGRPVRRLDLAARVYGASSSVKPRSIEVRIRRLRMKLEQAGLSPDLVRTLRGGRYLFDPRG